MGKRSPRVAAARRSSGSRTPLVVAVAVVVLVGVVVIGGVLFSGRDGGPGAGGSAPIPTVPAAAAYPTSVDGGVVVAGARAPHTLEVYEDALCPACQSFESRGGDRIARAVADGRLQVRYHLVNLLDRASRPAGYSTQAGNAMICAAENGAFPAVHASLYAAQPAENAAGWTVDQLAGLGPRVGAGPGYAECVTSGQHDAAVAANYRTALADPALRGESGFGTPTLVLDGRLLDGGSTALDDVLG